MSYQYQNTSNGGSQRNQTYSNTTYQRTVQYNNGENSETQRVVYYQDGDGQQTIQNQKYYANDQQQPAQHVEYISPHKKTTEVEVNNDFDEGVDVRDLQEEYIDLNDLDELLEDSNPEMKMMIHKKQGPKVMKTADEFDMLVSFKPPSKGHYPKDNKRLPSKGERYNDVNTNFGRLGMN